MDYRHEIKHMISPGDAMAIRTNLSAVASLDPHARQNGSYCIRSLYFDDPADTALREKLDGVSDKWTLKTVWGVGYEFELIGN